MTRKEAERLTHQENTLMSLGFTRDEAESLRRISMTLRRWYEQECGDSNDYASWAIERDEQTDKPYRAHYPHRDGCRMTRTPIADREKGAVKRLKAIIDARNTRTCAEQIVCPNCGQWQLIDCLNECIHRGLAPTRKVFYYLQTDPRGCALYILRPGDVPAGADVQSYYTRGIAVY